MKTFNWVIIFLNLTLVQAYSQNENPCKVSLETIFTPPLCEGEEATLLASYHPHGTYQWFANNQRIAWALDTQVFQARISASYWVVMTNDSLNCVDTSEVVMLNFNPRPPNYSTLIGPREVLRYSQYQYNVTNYPGLAFHWEHNKATLLAGEGTHFIKLRWDSLGTSQVSLVVSNSFGCFNDTTSIFVTISDNTIYLLADTLLLSNTLPSQKKVGVFSNNKWEVIENIPWLELDKTQGQGIEDVKITAIKENFGSNRVGKIVFKCFDKTDTLLVIQGEATSVPNLVDTTFLLIYPNPSIGTFTLLNQRNNRVSITLYDMRGLPVLPPFEIEANSQSNTTANLLPGTYIIELCEGQKRRGIWRIVFQ